MPTIPPTPPAPTVLADAIRVLAMDAVQAAGSGHPGMPMGMADSAGMLWRRHLKHSPLNPQWPDRDRPVLSNGHGSMLLYALLHLSGYDLPVSEPVRFRQLHSKTPGHPEVGRTPGVETSTGPLGQGLANAVGMALAGEFNTPEPTVVDHRPHVCLGDGCLMKGMSHEACSLAGTWSLGKPTALYDDNHICIDGDTPGGFTHDVPTVFRRYGWYVIPDVDGHDLEAIDGVMRDAHDVQDRPTLICCTVIGHGAPNKAGGHDVHGSPLGEAEIAAARTHLDWPHTPFEIPDAVLEAWDAGKAGRIRQAAWRSRLDAYRAAHPARAAGLKRRLHGDLPPARADVRGAPLDPARVTGQPVAMRRASQRCLEQLVPAVPELLGGSADLTPSNPTRVATHRDLEAASGYAAGSSVHYGVREFGMGAVMNGLALHGGFRPYSGTFLIFSAYACNAIHMTALMELPVVYVLTHDSIGVGEDGPTHQPVELAPSLRLIPGLHVWRPADEKNTAHAWVSALECRRPAALLLSRQNLPPLPHPDGGADAACGGYILREAPGGLARVVLIASGSEVSVALQAAEQLNAQALYARVVSIPCPAVFDRQDPMCRQRVLLRDIPAVAAEAAHEDGWRKYVGRDGAVVGLSSFGESGPPDQLYDHFRITARRIVQEAAAVIRRLPLLRS